MCVRKRVVLCFFPRYSGRDMVTCVPKINGVNTYFMAAYFGGKIPRIPEVLLLLLNSSGHSEVILGIDSNANSTLCN